MKSQTMHQYYINYIHRQLACYIYCIEGFVCEVLICANYASCRNITNFNSAVSYSATLAFLFHLTTRVTVLCLLSYVSVQTLQKRDTSASLPDPNGLRIAMVVCNRCMTTCSTSPMLLTFPNILVDMVSSDNRVYSNNDSTSDSTSQAIARDKFTKSRNLVIGLLQI